MRMLNVNDYKLVVITGSNEDEIIRFFGKTDEYRFHLDALKDYLYTYYNSLAEAINADNKKSNNEIIIYLNAFGDIVYLHSKGYGLLFVPKQITEKQKTALYDLFNSFERTPIYIDYNLTRLDDEIFLEGIVNYVDGNENNETLDNFFDKVACVKRKVR